MKVSVTPCLFRKDLEKYQSISTKIQHMCWKSRRDGIFWFSLAVAFG